MGFSSWTCAKTNLPIIAGEGRPQHPGNQAVLLLPGGAEPVLQGFYDGYQRLGGQSLVDKGYARLLEQGQAKLVLTRFHAGETFEQIDGHTHPDPAQGHFSDQAFLDRIYAAGGFADFLPYKLAVNQDMPLDKALTMGKAEAVALAKLVRETLRQLNHLRTLEVFIGRTPDVPAIPRVDAAKSVSEIFSSLHLRWDAERGNWLLTPHAVPPDQAGLPFTVKALHADPVICPTDVFAPFNLPHRVFPEDMALYLARAWVGKFPLTEVALTKVRRGKKDLMGTIKALRSRLRDTVYDVRNSKGRRVKTTNDATAAFKVLGTPMPMPFDVVRAFDDICYRPLDGVVRQMAVETGTTAGSVTLVDETTKEAAEAQHKAFLAASQDAIPDEPEAEAEPPLPSPFSTFPDIRH